MTPTSPAAAAAAAAPGVRLGVLPGRWPGVPARKTDLAEAMHNLQHKERKNGHVPTKALDSDEDPPPIFF